MSENVEKLRRDVANRRHTSEHWQTCRDVCDEIEQYQKALQWYADGNHMGFSPECDWENVSGEPPNWLQNNRSEDYEMIEDGGVARKVLAGETIDWSELNEETETTKNTDPEKLAGVVPSDGRHLRGCVYRYGAATDGPPACGCPGFPRKSESDKDKDNVGK